MTRILSAVAWPYANGPRHIGHVAGFGVPSDVFSRYMRMAGHDVLMVSGTDEHGTPILVAADALGYTAKEFADQNNRLIVEDLVALGLSYDLFTRTTTRNHYAVVQEMFRTVRDNGYMVEQTMLSAISPSTGRTLPDRYIEGTCPICGYHDARGDQCDNCGNQLDPVDLIDPRSKINGEVPQFVETTHYFLDLPALAEALGKWLDGRAASGTWRPNVIKFSQHLLEDIKPRAMTRDIDWGIPVPGWEDQPTKRLYVWFDAVVGYLSASIEWARRTGDPDAWRQWWNDPEALSYYFMGKDNIVFHSQIWPAELLGYDGEGAKGGAPGVYGTLNLPTEVVSSRVPHHGGQAVLLLARGGHLRARRALALPARRAALLHLRRRPRDAGLRLHLGRVRPAHQRRARRRLGQPRQPHRGDDREELRRDPRPGRARADRRRAAGRRPRRLRRRWAGSSRATTSAPPWPRPCAWWGRRTPTSPAPSRSSSRPPSSASAWPRCCTPSPRPSPTSTSCSARSCRTRPTPSTPSSAAAGTSRPMPRIEEVEDLDGGAPYPVITGDYGRGGDGMLPAWGPRPVTAGAPVAKPTPIFTKLDEDVVDSELARLRAEG